MVSDYYRATDWQTRLVSLSLSVGVVLSSFVAAVVVASVGVSVLALAGVTRSTAPVVYNVAATALQFVGFVVVGVGGYYLYRNYRPDDEPLFGARVPGFKGLLLIVGGFGALFVTTYALSAIVQFLGQQSATNQVIAQGRENPEFFLYMIAVTLLLQAPAEELVFRGVVQGLIRRAYGVVPAVLLTALGFGAVHYFALQGGGKLIYIAVAVALGLILGVLYELTDNVVVPSVTHGLWNAFLFTTAYISAVYDLAGATG